MNDDVIEITFKPPDLPQRMQRYPEKLNEEVERTINQALAHVQGSVPAYPARQSSYVRTGTLGRSIGAGGGKADIYEVRPIGRGYEARLGTNLSYAKHVISSEKQAWMHKGIWWTTKTIADKARPGVVKLFNQMSERLAAWLDGR